MGAVAAEGDERVTELYEGRRSDRGAGPPKAVLTWVSVALCAVLAGIGLATTSSTARPDAAARVPSGSRVRTQAPQVIELTFNPRSARSPRIAKVGFRFTYEHAAESTDELRERIERNHDAIVSRVWRTLTMHTADEFRPDGGLDRVENDLRETLDALLFPDGLGATCEFRWAQIVVQ